MPILSCTIHGCSKPVLRRGWCSAHYSRYLRYGDPEGSGGIRARHGTPPWEKILLKGWDVTDTGCWEYRGGKTKRGYGQTSDTNGKHVLVHRVSFEKHHRRLKPGELVRHTCDNPPCMRPDHLISGDHAANTADMHERGRAGATKLRPADVVAVVQRRASGEPVASIAASFDVHQSTIYYALKRAQKAAKNANR